MFGLISKFFKKSGAERTESPPPPAEPAPQPRREELTPPAVCSPAVPKRASVPITGGQLTLSFGSIISQMPKDLHGKISASAVSGLNYSISIERVLEQLPSGAVRVPFGELRRAAPAGVFVNNNKLDNQSIALPFGEILAQLPPDAFGRRPGQKQSEADADIPDLFGHKGEPLAQVRVMDKHEVPRPLPVAASAFSTSARVAAPVSVAPASRVSSPPPSDGRGVRAEGKATSSASLKTAPPPRPTTPVSMPQAKVPAANPSPSIQKRSVAKSPSSISAAGPGLAVSLASIAENWPEPIRDEIEQFGLSEAACEFPLTEIGAALRTGKVQSTWKQIRSRLKPAVSGSSPHGETVLDLPLNILAPAYLDHTRDSHSGKKASATLDIPDVFSKVETPTAAPPQPAPPRKPVAAAARVPSRSAEAIPAEEAPPTHALPSREPSSATTPAVAAPSTPAPVNQPASLTLPLSLVCESWPDAVRKEVEVFNLVDAKLEIPFEVLEEGLKLGRLSFRWRQVCLWMKPAPPSAMASAQLGTQMDYRVDLPLNFVAPLYLQHRSAPASRKTASLADIPDVFTATGQPSEAPGHPEPAPAVSAATPAPSGPKPARAPGLKSSTKPVEELAELFGEPEKRNWTPNDIVHKSTTLPGVAGAMIALQDGLLVASCMPPEWKTETIAAFLPQIFGRMRQYTNELKMGDLQSVTFSVDQGTLQVFNAGIIYFAALSQPDVPLPLPELTLIVKEIGRHTK